MTYLHPKNIQRTLKTKTKQNKNNVKMGKISELNFHQKRYIDSK